MEKKCKHVNIVFVTKIIKTIPEGWEEFNEKEDTDLEDYPTTQEAQEIYCNDCGEYFEEG